MVSAKALSSTRRRLRRGIIVFCTLFLLAWTARFAWLRITVRPTPRPEYWEARLAALDPAPEDAIRIEQAIQRIGRLPSLLHLSQAPVSDRGKFANLLFMAWGESIGAGQMQFLVKHLTGNRYDQSRRELLSALDLGWAEPVDLAEPYGHSLNRWPDPYSIWLPLPDGGSTRDSGGTTVPIHPYYLYRRWVAWLAADASHAWTQRHDPQRAVQDWTGMLQIARQVRRGRTARAIEFEAWMVSLIASEMICAAAEKGVQTDSLALANQIASLLGPELGPRELWAGERMAAECDLEFIFVREGWLDIAEWIRLRSPQNWLIGPLQPSRGWNVFSPLFHSHAQALRRLAGRSELLETCTDLAACNRIERLFQDNPNLQLTRLDGYPREVMVYRDRDVLMFRSHYASRTMLQAALATHALAAWRHDHGSYPETLDALVPAYLPTLPIDYADRAPLRYHRTPDAYILYSLGDDAEDNGGTSSQKFEDADESGKDVVFSDIQREDPAYTGPGMLRAP